MDRGDILKLCAENIAKNDHVITGQVEVKELDWTKPQLPNWLQNTQYDVILAADGKNFHKVQHNNIFLK